MNPRTSRRQFLTVAAGATTVSLLKPALAFGAQANARVSLGVIGCGGRGSWIAKLFADSGLYALTACSDYFQDRLEAVGEAHQIPAARRYAGLHGYRQLLESDVDAVVIETPPYFHPEQWRRSKLVSMSSSPNRSRWMCPVA
jgi:myo-inositol 2-dehydrogenase / D-chiro-inositol 1-dehydrogenase